MMIVWILSLGFAGRLIGGWLSPEFGDYGRWAGWGIGLVLAVTATVSFARSEKIDRNKATTDESSGTIDDICVHNPRVVEVLPLNDQQPLLAFEIGDGKVLLLGGQWLWDNEIFGADDVNSDEYDHIVNRLPEPFSFPSTEFTVSRFRTTGTVTRIEVRGRYLPPEKEIDALELPEFQFKDSEILVGSIDDLASMLERGRRASKRA